MLSNEDKKARTVLIAKAVNKVKEAFTPFGKPTHFVNAELIQGLQDLDCPYYAHVASMLEKQGFIVNTGERFNKKTFYYKFTTKEPIDYTHFYGVFDRKPKTLIETYKDMSQFQQAIVETMTEEGAVAFLKGLGYKLQKPVVVTEYLEV